MPGRERGMKDVRRGVYAVHFVEGPDVTTVLATSVENAIEAACEYHLLRYSSVVVAGVSMMAKPGSVVKGK